MRMLVLASAAILVAAPAWSEGAAEPHLRALLVERGLFDVARTEAVIARRHVRAALRETDLAAMKAETAAAVHAIDPALVARGPGLGTGLRPALVAAIDRLLAAQGAEPGSEDIALRTTAASVAGQTALLRADEALEEGAAVLAATSTTAAIPALVRMDEALARAVAGQDADFDGEIGWSQGEGGLQQAWSFTRQAAIGAGMELAEERRPGR